MANKKTIRQNNRSQNSQYLFAGVIMAGLVVTTGVVLFARTDQGAIDVSQAIENSNAAARKSAEESGDAGSFVPVRDTRADLPNGGLVGKGDEGSPPPPPPQVESASSTEESATSTDDGVNEDDQAEDSSDEETENDETDSPGEEGANIVEEDEATL